MLIWYYTISVLILIFVLRIRQYFTDSFEYWKVKNIPCAQFNIPFGSIGGLWSSCSLTDILQIIYIKYRKISQVCGFYIFTKPAIILTDLELIRNVFISDLCYFENKNEILEDNRSKNLKIEISSIFTENNRHFWFSQLSEISDNYISAISNVIENETELDLKASLTSFVSESIAAFPFGFQLKPELMPMISNITKISFRIRCQEFLKKLFPFLDYVLRFPLVNERKLNLFNEIISKEIAYRQRNNIKQKDILDFVLKIVEKDGIESLHYNFVSQLLTLFMEGIEATKIILCSVLIELSFNQDIQKNARLKIRNVLEKHYNQLTIEALHEMAYIQQIINESLRKHPPVQESIKIVATDYNIPGTEYVLEKGINIYLPIKAIHNDPELYIDPDNFNPDRFKAEEWQKRTDNLSFIPFGPDNENCMYHNFVTEQIRITLIKLIMNFNFDLKNDTDIIFLRKGIKFNANNNIHLKVTKR